MKTKIKIGPIQRREKPTMNSEIRKKMNRMKLGEFFEVTGVTPQTVNNIRAAVSYFSKKDGIRVSTEYSDKKLVIERVRK